MKTVQIFKREVLERTGFKKHPYKEVTQYTIVYDGSKIENHYEDINNPKLRIKFREILFTRSVKVFTAFAMTLGHTEADKWLKSKLYEIYEQR